MNTRQAVKTPYCCNDVTETYCNPNTKYGQLVYTTGLITGVIIFKPVADKVYYCAYQNLLPKDGCGNSCSAGWKCQDSTHKGYQNSDCGWNSIEYCSNGCSNGSCIQSSCIAGWKCKDGSTKAYQNSDCSWSSVTYCSNGCSNGECIQNIACNKSADCGSPYYGNPFCKNNNVTKNYNYFICNNAGTPSASCSSSIFEETIEACGTKQCVNGACASTGKCSKNNDCGTDGYIGNKFCKNGSVYQQYKSYKCNNAGQGNASCSSSTEDKFVQQCDYGCEMENARLC